MLTMQWTELRRAVPGHATSSEWFYWVGALTRKIRDIINKAMTTLWKKIQLSAEKKEGRKVLTSAVLGIEAPQQSGF